MTAFRPRPCRAAGRLLGPGGRPARSAGPDCGRRGPGAFRWRPWPGRSGCPCSRWHRRGRSGRARDHRSDVIGCPDRREWSAGWCSAPSTWRSRGGGRGWPGSGPAGVPAGRRRRGCARCRTASGRAASLTLTRTRGLASMFRTQSASCPRWAISQNVWPSRPSHTGVRRGRWGTPAGRLQHGVARNRESQVPRQPDDRVDHRLLKAAENALRGSWCLVIEDHNRKSPGSSHARDSSRQSGWPRSRSRPWGIVGKGIGVRRGLWSRSGMSYRHAS